MHVASIYKVSPVRLSVKSVHNHRNRSAAGVWWVLMRDWVLMREIRDDT